MSRLDTLRVPVARVQEVIDSPGFAFFPVIKEFSAVAGTTVTAHATIHTKGSWTQLIASTTIEASWLHINAGGLTTSGADTRALLDIGFGAAASEVVAIANIPCGMTSGPNMVSIPIRVPVGTRISARLQALITVDTATVTVLTAVGARTSVTSPATVDTIGADTTNSRGINMPTTDTYAEVISATTQAYRALIMQYCAGASANTTTETSLYTLATGASGSEVALGTLNINQFSTEIISASLPLPSIFPGHYPKGSRIACKQSIGRTYRDVIVFGIPYS